MTSALRRVDRLAYLRWFLVAALASTVFIAGMVPAYGQSTLAAAHESKIAKGRILVGKKRESSRADFNAAMKSHGARSMAALANMDVEIDVVEVQLGKERDTVAHLKGNKHIAFAEVDEQIEPAATVNDPNYSGAWHLPRINAPQAWDYTMGTGVTIAILDTGVDGTHPDLAPQMVAGWNFYDNNSDTADIHGHGTAVAGAAAAASNNGIGVASVAGGAKIMPLRIADPSGYAYWSTAAQAINYAADHGARVANLSYVGASSSSTIQSAASYLRSKGGVLLVAAGNAGAIDNTAPNNEMMVVSATQESDQIAGFSSYGSFVTIAAPGSNIYTTSRGGSYQYWSGTSLATPVVAGTAALIIARRPDFTSAQVDATLKSSATDLGNAGADIYFGAGRVNAGAAILLAGAAAPSDTTPPNVSITAPTGGIVSGTVAVGISASDNVGVSRVELRLNGSTIASDTSSPYSFSWNTTTIPNGAASLTAVAFDAAGNSRMSTVVAVTVSNAPPPDTTPPSVAITAPGAGATVTGQVTVGASASDNVGVTRVDFRVNGNTVATTNTQPYQFVWVSSQTPNGSASLTAVAFDAAGNSKTSAAVTVTVSNSPPPGSGDTIAPQAAITSPGGGTVSGVVQVAVNATDNVGVTRVEFRVNGSTVATTTIKPYQFAWNTDPLTDGSKTLTAVAFDAAGNAGTSSPITVNVSHPSGGGVDSTAPTLTITNPVGGAIVSGVVAIKATASDNSGAAGIKQTLYIDGALKASATGASLSYNWNTKKSSLGTHTIMVTARDAGGNSTSRQVQVTRR